jgi:phosphonatase-like hydrolase
MTARPDTTVPVRLAALDIAGTTVEEHGAVYDALHAAVAEAGGAATMTDVQEWMGAEKRTAIRALLRRGGAGVPADDVVDHAFDRFGVLLAEAYAARPPAALPGVPEAIARLRAHGVAVALTTGFTRDVTGGILRSLGWSVAVPGNVLDPAATLDAVVCADEVAAGRPAPYLIHWAMERTGVTDVAQVLAAGDTVLDLRAGAAAGAGLVVGVRTGRLGATAEGLAALRAEPHDALLDSVADLPAFLSGAGRLAAVPVPAAG